MVDAVAVFIICLMIAGFILFLEMCMSPGMILRRYRLFLLRLWMLNWRRKDRYKRIILKPLGLCIYCYSTWVSIISYFILYEHFSYDILLHIGLIYIFVSLGVKLKL